MKSYTSDNYFIWKSPWSVAATDCGSNTITGYVVKLCRVLAMDPFGAMDPFASLTWNTDTVPVKKTTWYCTQVQRTSTNFDNFWQRRCWESMPSNGYLLSHLAWLMSLHYLGKHEHQKCVFSVMLYTMSQKQQCFGLLYLQHLSTNFNNYLNSKAVL